MPQQKNKPSTAAQRAEEALEKAAPTGKSPARRTLDFLLEGSHDQPAEQEAQPPTMGTQSIQNTQNTQSTAPSKPLAPTRDFMKVPNSISRDAVPAGHFKGKSKQIYDYLYSKTRGAIAPVMSVRLTRREIMTGADIGSTKTLYINLQHLKQVGLVSYQEIAGPHGGNEYKVHLPEELSTRGTLNDYGYSEYSEYSEQKVLRVLRVESTMSTHSSNDENKGDESPPKTLYKTNTENDDDEAFAGLVASLRETIVEVTGKRPSSGDAAKLKEIGDLLAAELKIASSRTTVSSAPAFLAEHLRRRLRKSDVKQIEREVNEANRETYTASSTRPELNAEQLQEQVNLMVQLMRDVGTSIEELDDQFSGNFRPVQWHMIRGMALTQLGSKTREK